MPTLRDMRVALARNLESIPGGQVSPYMLSSPTHPCLYVIPGGDGTSYDQTMGRGIDQWWLSIIGETGLAGDRIAQELMDEYLAPTGEKSVKQAAESDPTLGGIVADLRVVHASPYTVRPREGGGVVLWVEWTVEVYAAGT
jgi:hypothetical protein